MDRVYLTLSETAAALVVLETDRVEVDLWHKGSGQKCVLQAEPADVAWCTTELVHRLGLEQKDDKVHLRIYV